MKHIRRSLGFEQIYRLKRREEFTEDGTESFSATNEELTEDIPPEVPLRDYEMLHYDYVPKPIISISSDASETSSDTSSEFGSPTVTPSGTRRLRRVRNLLHKMKLSPLKSRQKNKI